MAVDVLSGDPLQTGPVRELFRTNLTVISKQVFNYAATPDGQRFWLREPVAGAGTSVTESLRVFVNWAALVR